MVHQFVSSGLLDPQSIIDNAGPWGLLVVAAVIFAETGLLIGFFLPGDTLLFFAGVLALTGKLGQPLWLIIVTIGVAASLGGQVGYIIGRRVGPPIFERRESGLFSAASVHRTEAFFDRFGSASVAIARFVPVVRTFTPVAAGVGRMPLGRFTGFNILGAFAWSAVIISAGFLLGQIPGVAGFVSQYIDLIVAAIVVLSIGPALIHGLSLRRKRRTQQSDPTTTPVDLTR
jgi:membrane-associated protein